MHHVQLNWSSAVLGKPTTTQIILAKTGKGPWPVFYLLHGLTDDSTRWIQNTRLAQYVANLPLIIVMPDGGRSFYTDHAQGPAYAQHIGVELVDFIDRNFHTKTERGGRAIGGLSMGGYGALRLGLGFPDRFCSVNSHSGAVARGRTNRGEGKNTGDSEIFNTPEWERVFGLNPAGTSHDVVALAKKAKSARKLPKLLLDCGTEDFLIEENRKLHRDLKAAKIPHTYSEFPGAHNWDYWDLHIRAALKFHCANLGIHS